MVSKRSLKRVSREFQGSFKDILRKFPRCFREESSVFQENLKKKTSSVFQRVLTKFCFAILILHGSHRSYSSRRRACFYLL